MATGEGTDQSSDNPFDTAFDWKLGQSDVTTAVGIWCVIAGVATCGGVPLVGAVVGLVRGWFFGASPGPLPLPTLLAYTFIYSAAAIAMVRYFAPAPYGWWGRSCKQLAHRLPSERVRLQAAFEFMPGLRNPGWFDAIVLLAPYRVVIVSRAYRRWLIVVCFTLVAALVIAGELDEFSAQSLGLGLLLFLATAGKRAAFDQLPYAEITEVTRDGCYVTLAIAHGRLAPQAVLRTKKEAAAKLLAERLGAILDSARQGGDVADDAFVTNALRQLEATHEPA